MTEPLTKEQCACPSGSYGKKHSNACYERRIESLTSRHAIDQAALETANAMIAELKEGKERLQDEHAEYVATAQEEYKALELELLEALGSHGEKK